MRFASLRLLDGSIIVVFCFDGVVGAGGSNDSPVLYRCSLGCAIILCPSLPPFHLLLPPPPRSLFGQFNHEAMTPTPSPPSPFSSRCYTLRGGMALYGVSLTPSFSVPINPSLCLVPLFSASSPLISLSASIPSRPPTHPPSFKLQNPPSNTKSDHHLAGGGSGGFSPRSCPHPPTLPWSYVPESLLHLCSREQRHTAIKYPLITSR